MSRQEANELYREALKQGQKHHKKCVVRGSYPYLQVLDEILDDSLVAGRVNLGVLEIPIEQIVGTKTEGRKNAFAANFMPLLPVDSEFAAKWISLCEAHLGEDGIRDPIRCYEYLGRFYVQEGNKRVSVLKSLGAPTIAAYVIRVVPVWSQDPAVERYYEFLQFYEVSQLYQVMFTQTGGYSQLLAALGLDSDHRWTVEERRYFLSGFSYFQEAFHKLGGEELPVTAADALLEWLKLYPFETLKTMSAAELSKSLAAVWEDVKLPSIAVHTESAEAMGKDTIVGRLVSSMFPGSLTAAVINELEPEESAWIRSHLQGIDYLREALGDRVKILICNGVGTGERAESVMEEAIAAGAQVLFTTTAPMIHVCRKVAARYPQVRILNCSVSMPYTGVRTYYGRLFEAKFLSGAIAGAMSRSNTLGYVADYPIFGVPAGINAFALGAQLTNPRARVELAWSCVPGDPIKALLDRGIDVISALDIPTPDQFRGKQGACQIQPNGEISLLASPYWNWGAFYVKIVRSILNGGWEALNAGKNDRQAVNYWWGMASGVIGLRLSEELPEGVRTMAQIIQRGIHDGSISPFHCKISSQDGLLRNDGSQWLTPEELLHMDWLCDIVDGSIPDFDALLPMSQKIVRLQGIYRDRIPPERDGGL